MISVIVPVYNSSLFLDESIKSILNQSLSNFELILIDDGSTDNSGAICDSYSEKDARIKVIHQDNKGQAAARNVGIRISKGEWLCFVDSDDIIHPNYLEYLLTSVNETDANMSVCSFSEGDMIDKNFFDKRDYHVEYCYINEEKMIQMEKTYPSSYWLIWGKLIKAEIVKNNLFCEGKVFEDNAIAPKWLFIAQKIAIIDSCLYFYRNNETGTTKSEFDVKKLDLLWALEEQLSFLITIHYKKMAASILNMYINCVFSFSAKLKSMNLNRDLLRIQRKGKIIVRAYKELEKESIELRDNIFSFLHPKIAMVVRKWRR